MNGLHTKAISVKDIEGINDFLEGKVVKQVIELKTCVIISAIDKSKIKIQPGNIPTS